MENYGLHIHLMRDVAEKRLRDTEWRMMHDEKRDEAGIWVYNELKKEVECCDYLMGRSA